MESVPLLPEVASADVILVRRRVLGGPGADRVSGQISIGRSDAMRLRPDSAGLAAELRQAVVRDADEFHYYRICLNCTIRAGSSSVVEARLSVALRQAAVRDVPDPVVWSMDPLRASTPLTNRRVIRVNPEAKIALGASAEYGREFTTELCHLFAVGEGESQVEWMFRATLANDLVGVHRLSLVARTSARVACRAELAMSATCRGKRFALIPYRAEIPPHVATIRLSGR